MFYMGLLLAFMAGEIIVLYLLWDAHHVVGRTLNAVTFEPIIASFGWGSAALNQTSLVIVLAFEAGLLLVAGNTNSSAALQYWRTWPSIRGCRISSAIFRAASSPKTD